MPAYWTVGGKKAPTHMAEDQHATTAPAQCHVFVTVFFYPLELGFCV